MTKNKEKQSLAYSPPKQSEENDEASEDKGTMLTILRGIVKKGKVKTKID